MTSKGRRVRPKVAEVFNPGELRDLAIGLRRGRDAAGLTDGDPLARLRLARTVFDAKDEVPRWMHEWLAHALALYLGGRAKSLDDAFGLGLRGRANPMRRAKELQARRAALSRMFSLCARGATIHQAAVLVAQVSSYSTATLEGHYRRGGYTAELEWMQADHPWLAASWGDPEAVLAEYPDEPLEVAQAKAAIRAMHAKRRV